jgi:hypothetical protein
MPLREGGKALHQYQLDSIDAPPTWEFGSPATTHLLNIVPMMKGGLETVDVQ